MPDESCGGLVLKMVSCGEKKGNNSVGSKTHPPSCKLSWTLSKIAFKSIRGFGELYSGIFRHRICQRAIRGPPLFDSAKLLTTCLLSLLNCLAR